MSNVNTFDFVSFIKEPCSNVKCEHYGKCFVKFEGTTECICPYCSGNDVAPVCGSDGFTYASECHLRVASCKTQSLIAVASSSPCSK